MTPDKIQHAPRTLAFIAQLYRLRSYSVRHLLTRRGIKVSTDERSVWAAADRCKASSDDLTYCLEIERGRQRIKRVLRLTLVAAAAVIAVLLIRQCVG